MDQDRVLRWDGAINARDLAGLVIEEGRPILPGRLVRTASLHTLTAEGWRQAASHGIRSVIDVRSPAEVAEASPAPELVPPGVATVLQPVEPPGFVDEFRATGEVWKLGTPFYYGDFLDRYGARVAASIETIAAQEHGVALHCYAGRDRTGLIIAMLLDLLGVDRGAILADYRISIEAETAIETAIGKPISEKPVGPQDYPAEVADVLDRYRAVDCFADEATAAAVRARLVERLTR